MKNYICFFVLLLFTTSLSAQQGASQGITVKGQVLDSLTKETIPYATLSIAPAANPERNVTRLACDDDGNFHATIPSPGDYLFTFQSVAKNTLVRTFTIAANQAAVDVGKVWMSDLDQRLGEITVTAQKPLVKMDIDKITYNLEEDPEAKTNTVLEMLRKVPMITVDGEDKIQLKGADNFRVYLNGKPTNMLSGNNASSVLKSMPASSVKNIEVITDPGAKYDAEGVGGIINIITSRNALQGYTATINAEATSLGGYRGGGYITTKAGKLGLTANYNYNYNNRPWTNYESSRDQYGAFARTLVQNGKNKNSGTFQFGALEASYEIDTLNLISVSSNLFGGASKNRQELKADMMPHTENERPYSYDLNTASENTYGETEANVDFQHSTRKKDELLTFSYRFSLQPNNSESETYLANVVGDYYNNGMYPRKSTNDAHTDEHTGQIDYTTPTWKDQTLETGVKYILRQSLSDTREQIRDESTGVWNPYERSTDEFNHSQHIYSGYFAYAFRHSKFSYKAGVRAEGTALDVKYAKDADMDFSTHYFDVVPNATVSYMLRPASQLRLGYNMRIYRPGIWYLNPYVNNTDPQNISYGNPLLSSEKSHGINLNYSVFTPKININGSLTYQFVNNSIERYTFVNQETGVNESTYENIGKNQYVNMFLYGRWTPAKFFNIALNAGVYYLSIESPALGLSNDGLSGLLYGNAQFTLPKDFSVNGMFQYSMPSVQLQSKTSSYMIHALMLNKAFLNKKLTVSLVAQSPFSKYIKFKSTMDDKDFHSTTINYNHIQEFSLRVTYRFGTLKGDIKQVRRGISNDDAKSGGNSSGGEGAVSN